MDHGVGQELIAFLTLAGRIFAFKNSNDLVEIKVDGRKLGRMEVLIVQNFPEQVRSGLS